MKEELRLKIETYLGGGMSPEESQQFEHEMANDKTLAEEVKLAKQINLHFKGEFESGPIPDNAYTKDLKSFLSSDEAAKLKATLRKVEDEHRQDNAGPNRRNLYMAIAAIAIILLSVVGYNLVNANSNERLYASYYNETDLPSVIKRGDENSPLILGVTSFKEDDFGKALTYFKEYTQGENINPTVYLYAGMANSEEGKLEAAIAQFDLLINSNSLDKSKGYWFKAMAYLKADDRENAQKVLAQIAEESSNFKYKEAKELLEKME